MKSIFVCAVAAALIVPSAMAGDFGENVEKKLEHDSKKLFGFDKPLKTSSSTVIDRAEGQSAGDRQELAKGLKATFISRSVGYSADMIAFWPDDLDYSHLIVCNEMGRSGTTPGGAGGYNPSVQRIDVDTGEVETILSGMARCDGIRTTQWGTILATEESGADGGAYEILNPLSTTGHWVADRGAQGAAADIRDGIDSPAPSSAIIKRIDLAAQSWEGLEVLDNGVVIGGDELRPAKDEDGGAVFRFVPATFYDCHGAPVRPGLLCDNTITDLSESPLVSGQNYALATVCSGTDDFGQGCEAGRGLWVEVNAGDARAEANTRGATGYCRPEDLHVDRSYGEFVGDEGIRWCWNNTCGAGFGETLCVYEDSMDARMDVYNPDFGFNLLSENGADPAEAFVTRFVDGDLEMNSHDNLEIQPHTSNVYIIEDNDFGDVWACLPDGEDRNFETDGCVRMLSINSNTAEPSGFIFDGTGEVAFYHVQHGQQPAELLDWVSNPVNGRTDDLIMITGFNIDKKKKK